MNLLTASERIYRALLIAYPADFRREYAAEMTRLFRDTCRDAYRQGGIAAALLWSFSTLVDLILTALQERRKVNTLVQFKPFLSRSAGLLLMIGGVLAGASAISQLVPMMPYNGTYIPSMLIIPAYACVALGLEGTIFRYYTRLGLIGRLALWLAGCGAMAVPLGALSWIFNFPLYWVLGLIGVIMSGLGLVGFALVDGILRITPWSRLLSFPTLIVGALPIALVMVGLSRNFVMTTMSSGVNSDGAAYFSVNNPDFVMFGLMALVGACWIGMGYLIQRDQRDEPSIAAPSTV